MQTTLAGSVEFRGIGIHTGEAVLVKVLPARADHGIVFVRIDAGAKGHMIPAYVNHVTGVQLATTLSDGSFSISTVEHLLAALYGLGVDNALIEVDGPEIPIMDGSASHFCQGILQAGLLAQDTPRRLLRILETVEIIDGEKWARFTPRSGNDLRVCGRIEFDDEHIGVQEAELCLSRDDFVTELASARTFGFASDVDALRESGFARGGSLENVIVLDKSGVINPGGLRYNDEFIRHKLLDAIGDLSLAGARIAGCYEANQPGHKLNYELVSALFATPSAWCFEYDTASAPDVTSFDFEQPQQAAL
ncbi:MAG: UDP-3-O-acyl-N-acetylglucosamine deacetylase [Pseudomonadota bacterium]